MATSFKPRNPPKPFATLSTDSIPVADRLDFWQHLFVSCDVAKPADPSGSAFHGRLSKYARGDGSTFARITGGPLICRFGKQESGLVLLGLMRRGTLQVRLDDDSITTLDRNSGLVLVDCDQRVTTTSTEYDLAQLILPRELVMAALGRRRSRRDNGLIALPGDGLAPLLRSHLDAMATHGDALDDVDASAAMYVTTSLAMAFLSRASNRAEDSAETFEDALFVAARRYIEVHASQCELTARMIAGAVGCSRAHLYRIFLERGCTIGQVLREVRLARARDLLETESDRPIGTIAFESGYSDLSAFGKAFRKRFGMSPRECRFEVGGGQSAMDGDDRKRIVRRAD